MYGTVKDLNHNLSGDASALLDESYSKFNNSAAAWENRWAKSAKDGGKMNALQTYMALIKGYCGMCLFLIPKAFWNGGWVFSALC
jgi:hypothetical protein